MKKKFRSESEFRHFFQRLRKKKQHRKVFEEINLCRSIRNALDVHRNAQPYKFRTFAKDFLRICLLFPQEIIVSVNLVQSILYCGY